MVKKAGREARPTYRWYVVGMLWWIAFFNYADRQAIFSVFPLLEKEFHLSLAQLGLLGSSFAWAYGLCAPFAGNVVDRVRREDADRSLSISRHLARVSDGRKPPSVDADDVGSALDHPEVAHEQARCVLELRGCRHGHLRADSGRTAYRYRDERFQRCLLRISGSPSAGTRNL